LAKEIPYRVIFPLKYKPKDSKKYSVIYLLHGLDGHYDNWSNKTKIAEYASQYNYIIVMAEGNNGWYSDSVSIPNDKYESYIIQELISEVDKIFPTLADKEHRVIAGLSMGGYGSIKFGLKFPDKFVLVGSFSGALDSPLRGKNNKFLRPSIVSVFGEDDNPNRKANDVYSLAKDVTDIKKLPFIYFACGTEDFLFNANREFVNVLNEKKIPHEYRELPGTHNWEFWDSQIKEFLQVTEKFLNTKQK
jgi:S-formylglutathione hydrolase FrmB